MYEKYILCQKYIYVIFRSILILNYNFFKQKRVITPFCLFFSFSKHWKRWFNSILDKKRFQVINIFILYYFNIENNHSLILSLGKYNLVGPLDDNWTYSRALFHLSNYIWTICQFWVLPFSLGFSIIVIIGVFFFFYKCFLIIF